MIRKFMFIVVIFFASVTIIADDYNDNDINKVSFVSDLLYDNVWGTIYHAVIEQCDDTPTVTGDGSHIDTLNASAHRWIAISQNMLYDIYRASLIGNDTTRFNGKISYGDTIWIVSPNPNINGWWVVRDTKNKRYTNSIDFLQTKGDGGLYNNDNLWSGKFDSIKIFGIKNLKYLELLSAHYTT